MTTRGRNPNLDALWNRVEGIFDDWVSVLGLGWLDLRLYRCDTENEQDADTAANTDAKWQYRQARVTVFLPTIAHYGDDTIEGMIVHELVHVLVCSMESAVAQKHSDQCELAVENVARALLDARKAGR